MSNYPSIKASPTSGALLQRLGTGSPLTPSLRAFLEPRFGLNFGHIRIHTDTQASKVTQALKAQAFTSGNGIVFGNGQYQPDTPAGNSLLAHELTHVVQQSGSRTGVIQRKAKDDDFEGVDPTVAGIMYDYLESKR